MPNITLLKRAASVCLLLTALAAPASANMLANPGFEAGFAGWTAFGNAFPEPADGNCIVPLNGNGVAKMFGNFSGGFDVTGIFQEFATTPGVTWTISSSARYCGSDAILGAGLPDFNWVVQKIAFFDGGGAEIGSAESVILDGTFAADVWHTAAAVNGLAPAGTVKVQAFILYLQPFGDGGAALIDDVSFTNDQATPTNQTSWGRMKTMYR